MDPHTSERGPGPRLSLVVPVFDEAERLEALFAALIPAAEAVCAGGEGFEVLCVDDGSRDGSLERLHEAAERDPRVRVEALTGNCGKGAAVRKGVLCARGERIVFLDADLSTELDALEPMLAALDAGDDLVLGSRRYPGARIVRHQPFARELLGRAFSRLSTHLFAPEVRDFTCGFKGLRAAAARRIFERATIDRWAFDLELVVIARELSLRVGQIGVSWSHRGGSKVRVGSAIAGSLRDLARIALRCASGAYRR